MQNVTERTNDTEEINLSTQENKETKKNNETKEKKIKKRIVKKKFIIENDIEPEIEPLKETENINTIEEIQEPHSNMKNQIINEDCLTYLQRLTDKSIDTIILDPPYYQVVKEVWDNKWSTLQEYLEWIESIIKELERVAKYSSSLWIFGYAYQLGYIIPIFERHGFTYRQHITINKGMKSVAGRTSNKLKMFPTATEHLVYFHKEARHVIKDILRENQRETKISSSDINLKLGKAINGGGTWSTIAGEKQKNLQYPTREDWYKLDEIFGGIDVNYHDYVYKFNIIPGLTDVWDDINFYDKTFKKTHPTQKPYKLIERLIQCSTEKKDNILDIFMGSGMTGLVCRNMERNFYGCELDKKYCDDNLLSDL